jgi:hypothetical protein
MEGFAMSATYSPEDNKLRLYVGRVPRPEYEELRKEGWISTPKQDCDFVATWTPAREDRALSYLEDGEDIEDEDYSPEERAADRAERFSGYRDKRRDEAGGFADRFETGPSVFGHQNRDRAERQAARHDRLRGHAVSQWSKAEYWQTRTAGVIRHALHKSSASVRRGRILTIETERRRLGSAADRCPVSARWLAHFDLRLAYERAMLETEGGMASEAEIEVGGWFGRYQVAKVNKSPATGRVVSIGVWGEHPWKTKADGTPLVCVQAINIERLPKDSYRAPTDEEREAFKVAVKERKAKAKATTPKAPSLINPTDDDAERLQSLWNAQGLTKHEQAKAEHRLYGDFKPSAVCRMTQAQYSNCSKGTYANFETIEICENGFQPRGRWEGVETSPVAFKIRKRYGGGGGYTPNIIIVITDKPQKPLPLNWEAILDAQTPAEAEMLF